MDLLTFNSEEQD